MAKPEFRVEKRTLPPEETELKQQTMKKHVAEIYLDSKKIIGVDEYITLDQKGVLMPFDEFYLTTWETETDLATGLSVVRGLCERLQEEYNPPRFRPDDDNYRGWGFHLFQYHRSLTDQAPRMHVSTSFCDFTLDIEPDDEGKRRASVLSYLNLSEIIADFAISTAEGLDGNGALREGLVGAYERVLSKYPRLEKK